MNNILDKGQNPCSSCGVCAIACPTNCITISLNEDGFYRPIVDAEKCTSCGICKKVCYQYLETSEPFVNYFRDKAIYGAWSKDEETRLASSSGGVGHELIKAALQNGYQACGVIFDAEKDTCMHQIAQSEQEAENFRSSKYLQSYTPEAFSQFKKDEKYLVVGTPCQIYGLRQWLRLKKWEDHFILIDFFCHGTPTYLLWKKYQEYIRKKYALRAFKEVKFRSKEKSSWHKNAMKISDINNKDYLQTRAFSKDIFFKFFLSDTCLNEACYQCRLRLDFSASDIRLADFWGKKYIGNEDGVTLIAINTDKGKQVWFDTIHLFDIEQSSFDELEDSQPKRFHYIHPKRKEIINLLCRKYGLEHIYRKTIKPTYLQRGAYVFTMLIDKTKKMIHE